MRMTDDEIIEAFSSCTLPADQWTHTAHVRVGWINLQRLPLDLAIAAMRDGIRRYNASLNKSTAYHDTITVAFMHLISHRMRRGERFEDFCVANPDLLDREMKLLLNYYQKETLYSPEARAAFVGPDLADLPASLTDAV